MPRWEMIFSSLAWVDIYVAVLLLVGFLVASWLAYFVLRRVGRKLVDKSGTELDNMVLGSLEKPLFISLGLFGLWIALAYLPFTASVDSWIGRLAKTAFLVLGVYTGVRAVDVVLRWYMIEVAPKTKSTLDDRLVPFLRLIVPVAGGLLGVLAVLEIFGIPVEPVKRWLAEHGGRLALIFVIAIAALFILGTAVPRMVHIAIGKGKPGEHPDEVQKRLDTLAGVLVTSG